MAKKLYEESHIAAIAEKIRSITCEETTYKTSEMPDGIDSVYNIGYTRGEDSGGGSSSGGGGSSSGGGGGGSYDEGYEAGYKAGMDENIDTVMDYIDDELDAIIAIQEELIGGTGGGEANGYPVAITFKTNATNEQEGTYIGVYADAACTKLLHLEMLNGTASTTIKTVNVKTSTGELYITNQYGIISMNCSENIAHNTTSSTSGKQAFNVAGDGTITLELDAKSTECTVTVTATIDNGRYTTMNIWDTEERPSSYLDYLHYSGTFGGYDPYVATVKTDTGRLYIKSGYGINSAVCTGGVTLISELSGGVRVFAVTGDGTITLVLEGD